MFYQYEVRELKCLFPVKSNVFAVGDNKQFEPYHFDLSDLSEFSVQVFEAISQLNKFSWHICWRFFTVKVA